MMGWFPCVEGSIPSPGVNVNWQDWLKIVKKLSN
jgi:hypothetical protein